MKASREMISGEISWAFVALVHAWAGAGAWPFSPGLLHKALAAADHATVWPIIIAPPALALMVLSQREWWGADKNLADLNLSVTLRGWACLLLLTAWLYMLYVLIPDFGPQVEGANTLIALAGGGVVFTGWFYVASRMARREIREHLLADTLHT